MASLGGNESQIYGISAFTISTSAISYKVNKYTDGTDNLTVKIGSTVIATRSNVTGSTTGDLTRTFTFTSAELTKIYNAMPTVTKATFTFTIATYIGSTLIGSSNATATGTLAESVKPSITSIALSEAITEIASQFGGYVQNQSKIAGVITATAGAGSSIASYKTVINGQTLTTASFTTSALKTAGTNTATVTVTDRRGRTATSTATFTVIAYNYPTISTYTVVRCLADGTEDVSGESVKININSSIVSVNNKNSKSFILEYKKKGDTAWTSLVSYNGGYVYVATDLLRSGYSSDYAYDFRLKVKDYFHEAIVTRTISTGFAVMDLLSDGTGVAFGKVSNEKDTMDIGFKKTFLSNNTYMGGHERNDLEKNIFFNNTPNATNKHNVKIYGGSGESNSPFGVWDVAKNLPVFQYFDNNDYRFKFGENINLKWGTYDIESVLAKVFSSATGRYRTKTGMLLQWGSVTITPVANTPTSVAITFPITYDDVPSIQLSVLSGGPGTNVLGYGHLNDSVTGATLYVTRTNTIATVLRWFAIGFKEV